MAGKSHSDTLSGHILTTESFPDFYARILALHFPISVAEVLELRDLINHSADVYEEPDHLPQNREFRDSLEGAIHSLGIENRHHCERMLGVLGMLRGMHYQHTIASRDTEQRLRRHQAANRTARIHNLRNGMVALALMTFSGMAWLILADVGWVLKFLPLLSAVVALGYFHSLPLLERDLVRVTGDLNEVLRKRVETINWRNLIQKLALLLGYKKIEGVEVFRHQHPEADGALRLH